MKERRSQAIAGLLFRLYSSAWRHKRADSNAHRCNVPETYEWIPGWCQLERLRTSNIKANSSHCALLIIFLQAFLVFCGPTIATLQYTCASARARSDLRKHGENRCQGEWGTVIESCTAQSTSTPMALRLSREYELLCAKRAIKK